MDRFEILNPREYPDWEALLLRSGDHSFFHTSAWAMVLEKSYRFKPLYFVSLEKGQLSFLMPLMEVRSPFTGKRGVSLPFSDQCAPHVLNSELFFPAVRDAIGYGEKHRWKFLEWRDIAFFEKSVPSWEQFYAHDIDLTKTEPELFAALSDTNRRNIKKAVREGLVVKIDRSAESLKEFYRLNCQTRKRHGLPPQPFSFFENVFEYVISKEYGVVVSALFEGKAIAASLFFHFGTSALYKYGASEMEHQNLRSNNLVMWEALKWYRQRGYKTLSLGRTECENQGLLKYKRAWGAQESISKYYRYDIRTKNYLPHKAGNDQFFRKIFSRTPIFALRLMGRLFYKHVG